MRDREDICFGGGDMTNNKTINKKIANDKMINDRNLINNNNNNEKIINGTRKERCLGGEGI